MQQQSYQENLLQCINGLRNTDTRVVTMITAWTILTFSSAAELQGASLPVHQWHCTNMALSYDDDYCLLDLNCWFSNRATKKISFSAPMACTHMTVAQ